MAQDQRIYAYEFEGKRHDIGNRLDYIKTAVEFALKREDLHDPFEEFLLQEVPELIEASKKLLARNANPPESEKARDRAKASRKTVPGKKR